MRALERRVQRLEGQVRRTTAVPVRLLWDDEVVPCSRHRECVVERSSGAHCPGVIRLSFGEDHA